MSNTLLQKALTLLPLTETGLQVFVATMTTFFSNFYDALEETFPHMNSIKLKSYPGKNVIDCFSEILVDAEHIESVRAFKPEHLGYIACIFEDTSDYRFHLWDIYKYKDVA